MLLTSLVRKKIIKKIFLIKKKTGFELHSSAAEPMNISPRNF